MPSSRGIPVNTLCRLLFRAKKGNRFRAPPYSPSTPIGKNWPLMPFALYQGIPILIDSSAILLGQVPGPASYLDYCINSCEWSSMRYQPRSDDEIRKSIDAFIKTTDWGKALPTDEAEKIENQGKTLNKQEIEELFGSLIDHPLKPTLTLRLIDSDGKVLKLAISIKNETNKDFNARHIHKAVYSGTIIVWYDDVEFVQFQGLQSENLQSVTLSGSKDVLKPGEEWEYVFSPGELTAINASVIHKNSMFDKHVIVPIDSVILAEKTLSKGDRQVKINATFSGSHFVPKPAAFRTGRIYALWEGVTSNMINAERSRQPLHPKNLKLNER